MDVLILLINIFLRWSSINLLFHLKYFILIYGLPSGCPYIFYTKVCKKSRQWQDFCIAMHSEEAAGGDSAGVQAEQEQLPQI